MVLGEMKQAVSSETDVILFNIDSKASSSSGRDAILDVFLRVFNEHLGFCKEHNHIAHMERYLDEKGKYQDFKDAFEKHASMAWVDERDAYEFNRDEVVQSLSEVLGQSEESCTKWVDSAESTFQLTVETFVGWVKEFLDSQETGHRIVFLVDEVGQFIGGDTHLMLNLQTITEKLGTVCKGRAWVVVTSQEDMDSIIGDLVQVRENDLSKIQGRFKTRLSLSSANVDEVIRKRLLRKKDEVCAELTDVFDEKKDVLNNQLSFRDVGTTYKEFQDADDFVHTYPFAPYQFKLLQRVFESIRKAGATGLHLSEGERSLLDAFQVAAESVLEEDVGVLIPLYAFYPSIEEFMDTAVKRTVVNAGENSSLKPFDINVLQVLFLIRYVEEMKGNVENLATLCLDKIDCDRLALKRQIEESLLRLEKESLISRSGDVYCFLTNEERDISREIKKLATSSAEEAKVLGSIIFEDALKDQRKHRFSRTNQDMPFNRLCDQHPFGRLDDDNPQFSVVTPLSDDYGDYNDQSCTMKSAGDNGKVLLVLKDNEALGRELKMYLRTDKYLKANDDTTAEQATRRIHRDLAGENQQRRTRLGSLVEEMLGGASCFIAGTKYELRSNDPSGLLKESLDYLIENTFSKLGYLKKLTENPVREMQAILRNDDAGQHALNLTLPDSNPEALEEVRKYIGLMTSRNSEIVMHDMCSDRFAKRPYGWPENETALLLVRLFAAGEILFVQAGQPIGKDSLPSTVPEQRNWRRIKIVQKVAAKAEDVKKAREVGRDVFSEMGPEDPDSLSEFLRTKLRAWKDTLARYQEYAEGDTYPGGETVAGALVTIESCLSVNDNKKFLERFNDNKEALLDLSEDFHALDGFYTNQKPTWDKMLRSSSAF